MRPLFRKPIVCVLTATLLTTGCLSNPHGHGGKFIVEYGVDSTPEITRAPYKASYVLYQWQEPPPGEPPHTWLPENEVSERYVRGLARREAIGFAKDKDGQLVAVAGNEKIPLEPGSHYCWHISRDSEYHGVHRLVHSTGENVLTVAEVPFTLALYALMLPFFAGFMGLAGLAMLE